MYEKYMKYLYTDTMSAERIQEELDSEDDTTSHVLKPVEGLTDVPCHISSLKLDDQTKVTIDSVEMVTKMKVFCGPEHMVLPGDRITATRKKDGREEVYVGAAGKPVFGITQEFVLLETAET